MSICVSCGEFELLYVPACGDAAVGESNILLYAGDELGLLQAEMREVDAAFAALDQAKIEGDPQTVVDAQDALSKMLKAYIKPTQGLPDKHLVQAYSITGKKWTRIRSDKMRNHWRSYKIDKSLLQATSGEDGRSALNRANLRAAFSESSKKIATDLKSGITYNGQIAKGAVSGSITDLWDANWLKWVDAVNESLTYSDTGAMFDLSAGAQLLRGYAGFGVQLGYEPQKGNYALKGNAEAKAILGEAKVTLSGYFVDRDGWHALINFVNEPASEEGRQQQADFGYFRFQAKIEASAMLGASLYGTAGIEFATEPTGRVRVKPTAAGSKGELAAGAFAGVEAGGAATGMFEWRNPGWREEGSVAVQNAGWKTMVSVGGSAYISAGVGAEAALKITYENGKFMYRCEARAVLGVGAKGVIAGTIDFRYIKEFIMYVYNQLKDNDFAFLYFIQREAYQALVQLVLLLIDEGSAVLEYASDVIASKLEQMISPITNASAAEDYARKIQSRPAALIFAPPEAKAAILHKLSERFVFSFEERQEAAILTVVGTVQTQREWQQVIERVARAGIKSDAASGMARLRAVLDGGSRAKFETLYRAIGRLPPNTMLAGTPVIVRNLA
ncbi:hypothetical protein BFP70_01635 [Thioclava sp. SK-1]|uniref:hypothetical protein n=1 Tax=Thioclava sp. SK-1 TaxID=1889770 RepID=UPI000826D9A5|nr:hypothetical protein [Thioclava sp. SK-1]OCX67321.1 hypothetical protein BFP70_01635 [Thioclava sp. SK-1]